MPFVITPGIAIVLAIIVVALVLFVWEPFPVDVTAIGIMVSLIVLGRWTGISPEEGVSGFSNSATLTILAMMILSEGVRRTGIIQRLATWVSSLTGDSTKKQLGATTAIVGPLSGLINNTAAVAMLLPMVTDLAHKSRTSPSKLLLPLSYASMLGGMLTLIGTSTNLLASSLSADLLGHQFTMFEFTHLGAILFLVGSGYLLTVGHWLTPARVDPRRKGRRSGSDKFLTEVMVSGESPLIGETLAEVLEQLDFEANVMQVIRIGDYIEEPPLSTQIRAGDVLTVRLERDALGGLLAITGVHVLPEVSSESELDTLGPDLKLVEIVVTSGSDLVGETIETAKFREQYPAAVLAIRRGGERRNVRLGEFVFEPGDLLVIESDRRTISRLADDPNVIVAGELALQPLRTSKLVVALGIVIGVVLLATLGVAPIMVTALGGVVAMLAFGVLKPSEAYDSVQWDVIFLLAGVIPLGKALQKTGGADLLGSFIVQASDVLPAIGLLGVLYLLTALMTNLISNQASVVLLIPVAVDVATQVGANPIAFVLAVMFAASTAFMTPVGYQTNLFVYGPGGYRFSDFVRVGGPLQLVCAVVTTLGIYVIWGV
jgi:di/tricarboxylate transporter